MKTLLSLFLGMWVVIDLNQTIFAEKIQVEKGPTKAVTSLAVAKSFVGTPYVAHTLERSPENLVCNLREFDCYTFVESVLAITHARHHQKSYMQFQNQLVQMRYRNGVIDGYGSRLHYFLEWKFQGEAKGLFDDVTEELGGTKIQPSINFMTSHRAAYAGLVEEKDFQTTQEVEAKLSSKSWHYLPKKEVEGIESKLQDGDIIGITSGIEGLDFNHEGFVVKRNGRAYLLHASLEAKKVIVATETLADYLQRVKKHSGIVVLRIK